HRSDEEDADADAVDPRQLRARRGAQNATKDHGDHANDNGDRNDIDDPRPEPRAESDALVHGGWGFGFDRSALAFNAVKGVIPLSGGNAAPSRRTSGASSRRARGASSAPGPETRSARGPRGSGGRRDGTRRSAPAARARPRARGRRRA